MPDSFAIPRTAARYPAGSRNARLHDTMHLVWLAMQFHDLPEPSTGKREVSFSYVDETDAEMAAEAVKAAERLLSTQLGGVEFKPRRPPAVGSAAYYQRWVRLESGLFVYITARAEVGPVIEALEDAGRELAEVA